jgi:NAD(P)-dependent dehydrogenase (short-subunit alcohol dehydrogenase family)
VVVTGATSGLGLAGAVQLAGAGAALVLVGRDRDKLAEAARRVEAAGSVPPRTEVADLGDLEQVAGLADRLAGRLDRLDVLAHVAGALLPARRVSPQGTELTVTVHLLAPYLLTEQLLPLLEASAPARVVTMTSGGLYTQRFDLDSLDPGPAAPYDGKVAYARAKRAQLLLTGEWHRRYGPRGVAAHATHPGWAATPGLEAGLPGFARVMGPLLRTPDDGADTLAWLAAAEPGQGPGGRLWLDRRPRTPDRLPWTWVPAEQRRRQGREVWEWCRARTLLVPEEAGR